MAAPKGAKRTKAQIERQRRSAAVARYLAAIERGEYRQRTRTPEQIEEKLAKVEKKLAGERLRPLARLDLLQAHRNLVAELADVEHGDDLDDLEAAFIDVAAVHGEERGITHGTWREAGVPARVCTLAGI